MQLPFNYEKLNDSYLSKTPKVLSTDYFVSYSASEMKEKPAFAKVYAPTSILESKIVELENVLSDEKLLVDIEQNVFSTVLKNTVFQVRSTKCSTVSKAPQTFSDNSDDLFEVLPSDVHIGETSTKVGESVSLTADYYAHDLRKKKSKAQSEWRPKQKDAEIAESVTDNSCTKSVSSDSDIVGQCASNKQNLTRHMWYLESGCSKHMTGQKDLLCNYTEKFSGNVRFGNDQLSPILGYGDIIQDNITISKVSYVEGLGHNLFSIGQFCDKGLEVNFKSKSCSVRTEDGTELLSGNRKTNLYTINLFKVQIDSQNNIVDEYLESIGISHQYSAARMPEQNGVVERRNRTLVEAARTMLSQSDLPLFLWSLNKFSAMADEGIFIGYSSTSASYRVYLKKSNTAVESVNVTFDEEMASDQISSEPVITRVLASGQISPEPASTAKNSDNASTSTSHLTDLDLLFEFFYDEFLGTNVSKSVVTDRSEDTSCNHPVTSDVITEQASPVQTKTHIPTSTPTVEDTQVNVEPKVTISVGCTTLSTQQPESAVPTDTSTTETSTETPPPVIQIEDSESGFLDDDQIQIVSTPLPHEHRWTKEHPLHQVIGDLNKPLQTRSATLNQCMHDSFLSKIEPTRVSEALADSDWVSAM
ncbi:hypothetical protein L6452_02290 [Arctium lappa]|uniref:Uncharacterized protein n=1 Tax=Arctium lappa TaxID=4217 RepID=A0ACB9FKI0_ARCLA|nr:hypothetical protein L6452_02290 [Arctium lappa]